MDLVGKEFCKLMVYDFSENSIIRTKDTIPQYKLSPKDREKNLKDAFQITSEKILEPVLIIDDISTTGSTLKEMIKILEAHGIKDITCLVTALPESNTCFTY